MYSADGMRQFGCAGSADETNGESCEQHNAPCSTIDDPTPNAAASFAYNSSCFRLIMARRPRYVAYFLRRGSVLFSVENVSSNASGHKTEDRRRLATVHGLGKPEVRERAASKLIA